ncbi:MAG TPA: AAA family ATPase, partial [Myxococcaceae bacterium]|nr:AAA family ATPase [Myxococcaceae bacterium]
MAPREPRSTSTFTPREIVGELDRYIIGQTAAKRAVAIALRNRWRRQLVSEDLREEIYPKNIVMIGPTGVGKTEIARRLAKLSQAPFIKVEASKFTEVGYVGRDVESMIRDLVEAAISLVREEETEKVRTRASEMAEDRLVEILSGHAPSGARPTPAFGFPPPPPSTPRLSDSEREKLRSQLRAGTLDDQFIEIDVS